MGRPSVLRIGDRLGGLEILEILSQNKPGVHVKLKCLCHYCGNLTITNSVGKHKYKSCGCQQHNSSVWKSKGPRTLPWQLSSGKAAKNNVYHQYKKAAEKKNREFLLERNMFFDLIVKECYYCNDKLLNCKKGLGKTSGDFYYTGLDRIDSNKGYTLDNIVPCCWNCNKIKNNSTQENFLKQVEKIYKNRIKNESTSIKH